MKILSVVGARPEFIQAAPVSRALRQNPLNESIMEVLVHTGQHYDYQMSQAFFDELGIPTPDYNLGVGSGPHGQQTGEIMARIEKVMMAEKPDLALVRGDTNSTLASALAASKMRIPIVHLEAGERSFDRTMPEEVNRIVTDHLADLHLCASNNALKNLENEGIIDSAIWVGDVMLDAFEQYHETAFKVSRILKQLRLQPKKYSLVTVHRQANTDNFDRLAGIIRALNKIPETIVFPVHPRTRMAILHSGLTLAEHIKFIPPLGYYDMMMLEQNARLIATDSGGVQREAYFMGIPCLTLRDQSEWVETIRTGWNILAGCDSWLIQDAWFNFTPPEYRPPIFGDGKASQRIVAILEAHHLGASILTEAHSVGGFAGSLSAAKSISKAAAEGRQSL